MKLLEQLRKIIIAAPNLPIEMVASIALLIMLPWLISLGLKNLTANWKEGTAQPIGNTKIQDRIKKKEPEYFFKVKYEYSVSDETLIASRLFGSLSYEEAQKLLTEKLKERNLNIWYSEKNPESVIFKDRSSEWSLYFMGSGLIILLLVYFRWLFLKYYELEIEK